MKKKRLILSVVMITILSMGLLSACGKQKNVNENTTESSSAGFQVYAGFYCKTEIEKIENFEVTHTYGYLLNTDRTGVCYGQDVVDFTWDKDGIYFKDSTVAFTIKDNKLTVGNIVYDRIAGKLIMPNSNAVDINNIKDGIFNVSIDKNGINTVSEKTTITAEIFTEESYDIVDINRMTNGDVIYINGTLLPVKSIKKTTSGIIEINDGIENGGSAVRAIDESNCFVYVGMDMEKSYSRKGIAKLSVSDKVKLVDKSNPSENKEYTGNDAISALKKMTENYSLNCYNCSITVENGVIIEINRLFTP